MKNVYIDKQIQRYIFELPGTKPLQGHQLHSALRQERQKDRLLTPKQKA